MAQQRTTSAASFHLERPQPLSDQRLAFSGSVASCDESSDVSQVLAHILIHRNRRRGFQLSPMIEADVGQHVDHCLEINLTFAQVMGIIFQVDLAYPIAAQPADFLQYVETIL